MRKATAIVEDEAFNLFGFTSGLITLLSQPYSSLLVISNTFLADTRPDDSRLTVVPAQITPQVNDLTDQDMEQNAHLAAPQTTSVPAVATPAPVAQNFTPANARIRRPRNKWIIYRQERCAALHAENPALTAADICK